jgi:hypothetical protein
MHVTSYSSYEEMVDAMRQATKAANLAATPAQREIQPGDYWMRYLDEEDLWIFGRIFTLEELYTREMKAGAPADEAAQVVQEEVRAIGDGYRYGLAYSVFCPDGELGSTHIVVMTKLTKEQFDQAQDADWGMERLVQSGADWAKAIRDSLLSSPGGRSL